MRPAHRFASGSPSSTNGKVNDVSGPHLLHIATGAAAASVGAFVWTGTEYATHRWVLHGRLPQLGRLHRAHHRDPLCTSLPARAAGHVAIAGVAAAASSMLSVLAPALVARSAAMAWALGYSTYEITHWNAHHRQARTPWGERHRARHNRHHFGAPGSNHGVTVAFWDHLLGTEAPSSEPGVDG